MQDCLKGANCWCSPKDWSLPAWITERNERFVLCDTRIKESYMIPAIEADQT